MRFGILGETRAHAPGGGAAALGGPGRRAVLALLLLDAGRIVPVPRMVDGLYGDHPPAGVANALQSQVSRLRSVLGDVIENHPAGYRLAVDPDEVDVHRFTRLASAGRTARAAGEPREAARLLGEALELWRGPALADVRQAPFAAAQATRLEELRIAAVEERAAVGLALGRHGELVPELRELVGALPLRERLRAQLMRALAGSGRQFEALAVYQDARRELAETLGADPGPELAEAHLAVLRGDVSRETSLRETRGPGASPGGIAVREASAPEASVDVSRETSPPDPDRSRDVSRETSLPAQLTSFVGRSEELARIADRLDAARLVTLTGAGGAGKTRLSVEAAGLRAGEVCFVPLAGVTDGADVPQAVLGALGLREAGLMPSAAPVLAPADRLAAALADRELLLVLDNCEHVIDPTARLVAELLARCPALRVLATSREALGITGETLCPVPPLSVPPPGTADDRSAEFPAVRLFVERATAVRPDFRPDDERDAVLRICAALDGLPLAIELAAARLRSLSATQIATRLGALPDERPDEMFRLLSRGSRTAQPRQRTLRGVVDWSWDLLTEPERTVLRRASVFAGGWTLEAAEAVCADAGPGGDAVDPYDVLDLVDSLVDKSLVVADRTDGGSGVRYRMLETIRAYAAERLDETGRTAAARRAHAGYFLGLAVEAEPHLRRAEQLDWLRRLTADHDNLTAALHRCVADADTANGMRLLAALGTYWMLRGIRYEAVAPARRLLDAVGPNPPDGLREEFALCVMLAAPGAHEPEELGPHVAAAERIIAAGPGRYPVAFLLWAPIAGVPDQDTYADYEAALALRESEPWFEALDHLGAGYQNWVVRGRDAEAERRFTAALHAFRALGDRWGAVLALTHLSGYLLAHGRPDRALDLIDEALALAEEMGATENRAELGCLRGQCGLRRADQEAARADFQRALELARGCGAREFQALAHQGLADCARLRGDLDEALWLCELAMSECLPTWFSGEGTRAETLLTAGRVHQAAGDLARAAAHYREALVPRQNARSRPFVALVAEAAAELALAYGDPADAARLLGLAAALYGEHTPPGPEALRTGSACRAALGEPAYRAARAAAGTPDFAQALRILDAALRTR